MSLFFFLLCLSNQRQHRRAPTETKATVGSTPNSGHRGRRRRQCSPLIMRNMSNCISSCKLSVYFTQKKTIFFYFTHLFLQNTHVSLSILHIYSIKYSFFYNFLLFSHSLHLSLTDITLPKNTKILNVILVHLCTILHPLMWVFFCSKCVK